tara:strand:- start:330 stop:602 length:273 start_codon:yes stop_codon:yes gene_type:complete
MPRYDYACQFCNIEYTLVHSVKEKETYCPKCEKEDALFRLPSFVTIKPIATDRTDRTDNNRKIGDLVKQHIDEAKQEIKEYKEDMRKEYE